MTPLTSDTLNERMMPVTRSLSVLGNITTEVTVTMYQPDINPVIPGFTTDAERSSLEVSMSLRAVDPCDCNGVMYHNVLVHSGGCCRFERSTAAKLRATLPTPTRREVWS